MFWRKERNAAVRPVMRDPFDVIPFRPEEVEMRLDSQGNVHLRRMQKVGRVEGWIGRILGYEFSRKVELDACGSLYFKLLDGKSTLRTVVERMMPALGRERKETETMVVLFTKKLMTMDLIALQVPTGSKTGKMK